MKIEDRLALHRRMAEGYHAAYKLQGERQSAIYPEEWKFADDAVYSSPYFTGGQGLAMGEFSKSHGMSMTDGATMEAKVYSAVLPDWRPVEFMCWPSDIGFAMRTRFEGHTKDGARMSFHALDFVQTNEAGLIRRWETFVDGEEFGPIVKLAIGVRGPFRDATEYWQALGKRLHELGLM
jgi:hypothetical protein